MVPISPRTPDTLVGSDYHSKRKGVTLFVYPLALFVIILWVAFVSGLIWLLETSVSRAKTNFEQAWWITDLPTYLITVFAQGHIAITAMYLARLAISALQRPSTAPNSWAELFWLADRNWQGPFGLLACLIGRIRLGKVSLSTTFLLFSMTCMFAIPTPITLSKAYQIQTVSVETPTTIRTNALDLEKMTTFSLSSQRSAGAGAWGMGIPASQVYNATTYVAPTSDREGVLNDVVFAGQLGDKDANMTAIRMTGGCKVMRPEPSTIALPNRPANWPAWCQKWDSKFHDGDGWWSQMWNVHLGVYWCSSHNVSDLYWTPDPKAAAAHAVVWFNSTDGSTYENGFIECNSTFEIGTADLVGHNGTFRSFKALGPNSTDAMPSKAFFAHPMNAALTELTLLWNASAEISAERYISILRMYGFESSSDLLDETFQWKTPTLDEFANNIWGGVLHMGASVGALSRRANQTVRATEHRELPGRRRNERWALAAVGLLAGWAGMLLICTARMLRPTFGPSLDCYAAARLLVDVPNLVLDHGCGELAENRRLRESFKRVGDVDPDASTGHIVSGGAAILVRRREYS